MTPKLESITAPFSGDPGRVLELISLRFNPFRKFVRADQLEAPTTFVISHKSSASNKFAFMGLLTDYHNLLNGDWDIHVKGSPRPE